MLATLNGSVYGGVKGTLVYSTVYRYGAISKPWNILYTRALILIRYLCPFVSENRVLYSEINIQSKVTILDNC